MNERKKEQDKLSMVKISNHSMQMCKCSHLIS